MESQGTPRCLDTCRITGRDCPIRCSSWPPSNFIPSSFNSVIKNNEERISRDQNLSVHPDVIGGAEDVEISRAFEQDPCVEIPDVDWEEYKQFLFKVWQENSLGHSSLNDESSALPTLSSLSGDIPFALNLLTTNQNPSNPVLSTKPKTQPLTETSNKVFEPTSDSDVYNSTKRRRNSLGPNLSSQSPSMMRDSPSSRPFANTMTKTSKPQGDVNGARPALFLRSPIPPHHSHSHGDDALSLPPTHIAHSSNTTHIYTPTQCKHLYPQRTYQQTNPFLFHPCTNQPHTPTATSLQPSLLQPSSLQPPSLQPPLLKPPLLQLPPLLPYSLQRTPLNLKTPTSFHENRDRNLARRQRTGPVEAPFPDEGRESTKLKAHLEHANNTIISMSEQMEDQSSQLSRLIEERKHLTPQHPPFTGYAMAQHPSPITYPVFPQGGYKTPHHPHHNMYPATHMSPYGCNTHQPLSRRSSWQYPYEALPQQRVYGGYKGGAETPEDLVYTVNDQMPLESLRDQIFALQMQNNELSLFLKQEEMRRKEAEDTVRKERERVKKLQENIQDLNTTTLVVDPLMYRQMADKYIASRKKPVRRTHTCAPNMGSDLVCDSSRLHPITSGITQTSSCPSSPLHSNQERKNSCPTRSVRQNSLPVPSFHNYLPVKGEHVSPRSPDEHESNRNQNWKEGSSFNRQLSSEEYQQLLQSLDSLEVSSSPS